MLLYWTGRMEIAARSTKRKLPFKRYCEDEERGRGNLKYISACMVLDCLPTAGRLRRASSQ